MLSLCITSVCFFTLGVLLKSVNNDAMTNFFIVSFCKCTSSSNKAVNLFVPIIETSALVYIRAWFYSQLTIGITFSRVMGKAIASTLVKRNTCEFIQSISWCKTVIFSASHSTTCIETVVCWARFEEEVIELSCVPSTTSFSDKFFQWSGVSWILWPEGVNDTCELAQKISWNFSSWIIELEIDNPIEQPECWISRACRGILELKLIFSVSFVLDSWIERFSSKNWWWFEVVSSLLNSNKLLNGVLVIS